MSSLAKDTVLSLQAQLTKTSIPDSLSILHERFPGRMVFSTSFSMEDQVITDLICKLPVSIFTLDTGRLFPETYSTWARTLEHYHIKIRAYYPDDQQLQEFTHSHGPNSFYNSVDARKQCCHIRKVVPLQQALKGHAVWITGLRAQHSPDRNAMHVLEWDDANQIIKYNPLLHWHTDQVKAYITAHHIPYNSLHDRGFVSIGCAPCTRAIREGEDFRAGRWWWEDQSKKECGLHIHQVVSK